MNIGKKLFEQLVAIDNSVEINANIDQVAWRDVLRMILTLRNDRMLSEMRFLRSTECIDRDNRK